MKHWTDEYLVPMNACGTAIVKAKQYDDPQTAWDNWDNGFELLLTLRRCGIDVRPKFILCAYEIVERLLPLFEKKYPYDDRPRRAIEAARRCAEEDTEENRKIAAAAARAARAARATYAADNAAYATVDAAADAAYAGYADVYTAAIYAGYAAGYAANAVAYAAADTGADADAKVAAASERCAHADIVRKYFPTSPFVK